MPRKKSRKFDPHPWYALLDMEAPFEEKTIPSRPKGRPRSRFIRSEYKIRVTQDQKDMIEKIRTGLEKAFGRTIQRGDLVAFMTVHLLLGLQSQSDEAGDFILPEKVKTFDDLARYLDEQED